MQSSPNIERWPAHLAPILSLLRKKRTNDYSENPETYKDTFGNWIYFGDVEKDRLLDICEFLVKREHEHVIEVPYKYGRLFFTLQQHSGYYVLSETTIFGGFNEPMRTSYVVIPIVEELGKFLVDLYDNKE